ncbi:ATP-binding protein [Pseudomonas sp. LJDD11]|uniref:ATP-binding protein n=1 Tax=Pseudomonas sp. LJDD11 TaxID=2931984 RepID=UPI00211CC72A|nr:ATP-binding protein [Pseudomonas sp. LJDD11]MCQ9423354.1 ATP-binding protein [Pseudomonas sp. LJDD11]
MSLLLQTNLKGRLRNTSLPRTHGLLPVFEAVVNSIHSIEESGNLSDGVIYLEVERAPQTDLELGGGVGEIVGFTIIDNGCGFDETNFNSFQTLDSDHKIDKGCRGVGRLVWLKAFDRAEIHSTYTDGEFSISRAFTFDEKNGVSGLKENRSEALPSGSKVSLRGFHSSYQKYTPKTVTAIANQLLEHCLWYFVRADGAPRIIVRDKDTSEDIYDLYDKNMMSEASHQKIRILDHDFELTHIKFRYSTTRKHQIALCAANRLAKEEGIQGKIPGLGGKLSDSSGDFIYNCYVSSSYLDENVRSERTSFNIAEDFNGIFEQTEISLKMIRERILDCAKTYLQDYLSASIEAGRARINSFIENQAPRYRFITSHVPADSLIIPPDITDRELELHLHSLWYEVERQLVKDGHQIMAPGKNEDLDEYKERLSEYVTKAQDLKKSDLANYVMHRKVILDILQKSIERLDNGKYAREDTIHELIFPMGKDSDSVMPDGSNLWIIDERLSFHSYLASDKTLRSMPVTDSGSTKEPDLFSLRVFDQPILVNDGANFPLASLTIVEIKRPMRDDMKEGEDKDPIDQSLGYLERIREGGVTTKSGRPIPGSKDIPGYCYIICDLTPTMHKRSRRANLRITSDGMGYFGYNEPAHAYVEVISFDQLVKAAKERNRAFFDKLGLPIV